MLISFAWLLGCRAAAPEPPPREGPIKRLGIYYGWPSSFNGAGSAERAAAGLAVYDVVVLGAGLQDPGHGDHHNTRQIIYTLRENSVEVHGYIALGAATGLSAPQLAQQVRAWQEMGVAGIFFDEAGYDFGNSRKRQNQAFAAAHHHELKVFANAYDPDDLFSSHTDRHNPGGAPCGLRKGDIYLYESFGLKQGQPEDAGFRSRKLAKLRAARKLGVMLFGVTTSPTAGYFQSQAWQRVQELARSSGLHGLGWGEMHFAAGDGKMPQRPWPAE